ncbi:MAG: hypothetical protein AB1751_05355 [Acidobacteriota bacterium]
MGLALMLVLTACAGASSAEGERLWQALAEKAKQFAGFAPAHVESHAEVFSGDGEVRGTVTEVWTLRGWKKGEPDYEVQRQETGKPDINIKFRVTAQGTPFFAASQGQLRFQRVIPEALADRCFFRFEFAATQEDKAKGKTMNLEGVAWVDAKSGAPWKVLYRVPNPEKPIKKWELTLVFPSDPQAPPLPEQVTLHMEGQMLLWKRSVVLTQRLKEWTAAD